MSINSKELDLNTILKREKCFQKDRTSSITNNSQKQFGTKRLEMKATRSSVKISKRYSPTELQQFTTTPSL
jgi:hypothetical protein